jgi:hypothetical protein
LCVGADYIVVEPSHHSFIRLNRKPSHVDQRERRNKAQRLPAGLS